MRAAQEGQLIRTIPVKVLFVLAVTALAIFLSVMVSREKVSVETLAPDCSLWNYSGAWNDSPQEVKILSADISRGQIRLEVDARLRATLPQYHRAAQETARTRGENLVATVNGNVFGCIARGKIVSVPNEKQMTIKPGEQFYFGFDGAKFFVRPLDLIAHSVGANAPEGVTFALCSLPYYSAPIIWNGRAYDDSKNFQHPLALERHPRTIVGVSADGKKVFLVLIKGRGDTCAGMTFVEASAFLREKFPEIFSAVNLDGGYSSMLMIDGRDRLKMIPVAESRELPNALHVFSMSAKNLQ